MMIPIKKRIYMLTTLIYCLGCNMLIGQNLPAKEVEQAVTHIARLIEDNYVFADKGKAIAAHLKQQYKQGRFKQVSSWKTFDSLSTHLLQAFSQDGHLYVRYDPKRVKELQTPAKADQDPSADPEEAPFFYGKEAIERNFGFQEVKILAGNIGYIKLTEINISEKSIPVLFAAMQLVSHTKCLVIDLQNNGGGGSAVGNVLESFFLPKNTPLLEIKTRHWGSTKAKTEAWLTEKKYKAPLFILINKGTFSAAEAFAYSLQKHKRATVIGQPSGGGANMNSWYPVNEQIFLSISTGSPSWPGTEENWEQKGIQPDSLVASGEELEYIKRIVEKSGITNK